jgi:hypothetical protein
VAKSLLARSVVGDIAPVATPKHTDASRSNKMSKESTNGSALKTKSSTVRLKPPKEDKEDAYIAYLESKFGIDKGGKKKGKKVAEEEDGLDGTLQCFSVLYFDFKRVIGSRSHDLGRFIRGANDRSK